MINIYTWNLFVLYFWASTLQNKAEIPIKKQGSFGFQVYIYILMCECTTTHQTTWLHRICFFGCGMLNNHSRIRIWQTFLVLKDCEVGQHLLRWASYGCFVFPNCCYWIWINLSYMVRNYLAVVVHRVIPPNPGHSITPITALTIRIRIPCKDRIASAVYEDLKTSAVPQNSLQPWSALFGTWWDPAPSCTPLRCCKGCRSVEFPPHLDLCAKWWGYVP